MKMTSNYKDIALKIFNKALPKEINNIKVIKEIHNGYTNISFLFILINEKKYQVRLSHCGNLINRKLEYAVLKLTNNNHFIYFDEKTGNGVKEWLEGKNPNYFKIRSKHFLDSLFKQINKLHKTNIKSSSIKISTLDLSDYNKFLNELDMNYQSKFLNIVNLRKKDPFVLNHTDINPLNIIVDKKGKINFIDFEWCNLASDYWDYANWVRETNINYEKIDWSKYISNFSMNIFKQYLYLCSVYAYAWTFAMPQTKKIKHYKIKTLNQVKKYYKDIQE